MPILPPFIGYISAYYRIFKNIFFIFQIEKTNHAYKNPTPINIPIKANISKHSLLCKIVKIFSGI